MTDMLGHLFYLLLLSGTIIIGYKKSSWGWLLRFLGGIGWTFLGIHLGLSSIWVWSTAFALWDIITFFKWRKSGRI